MTAAVRIELDEEQLDDLAERIAKKMRARAKPATHRPIHKPGPPPMFAVTVSDHEHVGTCVYVLMLEGAFVYVGKTSEGFSTRAAHHFINKRFDTVLTLDVDFTHYDEGIDDWLFALERAAFNVLRPTLNCESALRGEPHKVTAYRQCLDDLEARICLACERSPTPRYTPPPAIDLHACMRRKP